LLSVFPNEELNNFQFSEPDDQYHHPSLFNGWKGIESFWCIDYFEDWYNSFSKSDVGELFESSKLEL
jgi:hypothetical protein